MSKKKKKPLDVLEEWLESKLFWIENMEEDDREVYDEKFGLSHLAGKEDMIKEVLEEIAEVKKLEG